MLLRLHRRLRRILPAIAAMPLLQATGTCDPQTLANTVAATGFQVLASLNIAIVQGLVSGGRQTLLVNFPSADILQILLGGNRFPFFP